MGHNAYTTPWTPEAVEYIRVHAAEPFRWTTGRISDGLRENLGFVASHNAVRGKANREGIQLIAHIWPAQATEIFHDGAKRGLCATAIAQELKAAGFVFTRRHVRDKSRVEKTPLAPMVKKKTFRQSVPAEMIANRAATTQKLMLMQQHVATAAEWVDYDSDPLPSSVPTKLTDLKSYQCKWPLRRDVDGDRLFCGGFKLSGSYCSHHSRISYLPPDERKILSNGPQEIHIV